MIAPSNPYNILFMYDSWAPPALLMRICNAGVVAAGKYVQSGYIHTYIKKKKKLMSHDVFR